jgi:hypothetical protein
MRGDRNAEGSGNALIKDGVGRSCVDEGSNGVAVDGEG